MNGLCYYFNKWIWNLNPFDKTIISLLLIWGGTKLQDPADVSNLEQSSEVSQWQKQVLHYWNILLLTYFHSPSYCLLHPTEVWKLHYQQRHNRKFWDSYLWKIKWLGKLNSSYPSRDSIRELLSHYLNGKFGSLSAHNMLTRDPIIMKPHK